MRNTKWLTKTEIKEILDYSLSDEEIEEAKSHLLTPVFEQIFETSSDQMVGNSLKSDVIPAIEAGSWGIYVPHDLTWSHEHAEPPVDEPRFHSIAHLGELPELISRLS